MGVFSKILRSGEGRKLKALQSIVPEVGALEPDLQRLTDDELAARTVSFRERLDNGADLSRLDPGSVDAARGPRGPLVRPDRRRAFR